MPWSNNILTYPFTKLKAGGQGDLEQALNYTATSFADLIAHGDIKKFARYKAISVPGVTLGPLTEAQRASVNFGLSAFKYEYSSGKDPRDAAASDWFYTRPITWIRALDFVKYENGAYSTTIGYTTNNVAPVRGYYVSSQGGAQLSNYIYNTGTRNHEPVNFQVINSGNDYGIGFSEMGDISNYYLCICVAVTNGVTTTLYMTTCLTTVGNGGVSVPITHDTTIFGSGKTWTAYVCLSSVAVTDSGGNACWKTLANCVPSPQSGLTLNWMPLPIDKDEVNPRFTISCESGDYYYTIMSAYRDMSGTVAERRNVHFSLYATNTTGETVPSTGRTVVLDLVVVSDPGDGTAVYNASRLSGSGIKQYDSTTNPTSAIPVNGGLIDNTSTVGGGTRIPATSDNLYLRLTENGVGKTFLKVSDITPGPIPDPPDPGDLSRE